MSALKKIEIFPVVRLRPNLQFVLQQAQDEWLSYRFLRQRSPFVVSLSNHERDYATAFEGGRIGWR